jgi:hypothetical protein
MKAFVQMAKHSITDAGDLRKYFAAIPNVVFQLGLNPYELALYAHFKQAAGDDGGVCWKSRATIAREAGMSAGMVTKARQTLEAIRQELGGRALITVKEEPSKTGGNPTCAIRITDIWALNMAKFSPSYSDVAPSCGDVEAEAPSPGDERRHTVTLAPSPHDLKEKPLKKNPEEVDRQRGTRLPDDFCLNSEMREWAAKNAPHVNPDIALAEFIDYWSDIPGAKGRKVNWNGTWRNRLRELESRLMRNGNGSNKSRYEGASERSARNLQDNLAVVAELRSESGGDYREGESGKPTRLAH